MTLPKLYCGWAGVTAAGVVAGTGEAGGEATCGALLPVGVATGGVVDDGLLVAGTGETGEAGGEATCWELLPVGVAISRMVKVTKAPTASRLVVRTIGAFNTTASFFGYGEGRNTYELNFLFW